MVQVQLEILQEKEEATILQANIQSIRCLSQAPFLFPLKL